MNRPFDKYDALAFAIYFVLFALCIGLGGLVAERVKTRIRAIETREVQGK
jgi:hypothetical protein